MAKKKNIFQRYFENFGLKQICDILIIVSCVLLIVGWCLWKTTDLVLIIALALFCITSLLAIVRCIAIIHREPNKRSPERRSAIINMAIMCIILVIALVGLIYGITVGFVLPANK